MAPQPKSTKGLKQLCATLKFIIDTNLDIAAEETEAGHRKEANEAMNVASSAISDSKKWGCGGTAARQASRKRIASLKRALARPR
jgi:hypothetical protein